MNLICRVRWISQIFNIHARSVLALSISTTPLVRKFGLGNLAHVFFPTSSVQFLQIRCCWMLCNFERIYEILLKIHLLAFELSPVDFSRTQLENYKVYL